MSRAESALQSAEQGCKRDYGHKHVIHHQNFKESNDLRVDSFEFTRTRTDSYAHQRDVFAADS